MWTAFPAAAQAVLKLAAAILILKVTLSVVIGYREYLPPSFEADFLLGREAYFWGPYAGAFYAHLAAGPVSLLVGTLLISERFRRFAPGWHRRLGRVQVAGILLLLVPSGLWMARYAVTGAAAGAGLATLAVATALCTTLGWRRAVQRRFGEHRQWMWRTYLLLCSAVIIRLIGGLATVLQSDALWVYPLSAWGSWLVPLAIYECWRWRGTRPPARATAASYSARSLASIETSARSDAGEMSASISKIEPSARTA